MSATETRADAAVESPPPAPVALKRSHKKKGRKPDLDIPRTLLALKLPTLSATYLRELRRHFDASCTMVVRLALARLHLEEVEAPRKKRRPALIAERDGHIIEVQYLITPL